jgi:hypothetical protein
MDETKYKQGFKLGYRRLRGYALINDFDVNVAIKELWDALEINNSESFRFYRDGKIEPKASKAIAVENVFKKYGVTDNIWGE